MCNVRFIFLNVRSTELNIYVFVLIFMNYSTVHGVHRFYYHSMTLLHTIQSRVNGGKRNKHGGGVSSNSSPVQGYTVGHVKSS